MTDSSDSTASRSSGKKSARKPATIDLKATVVDDGTRPAEARPEHGAPGEDTIAARAEPMTEEPVKPETAAEDVAPASEASFDSGLGTDSIASGEPSPPRKSPGTILASGLVGGLVGAGLVYGLFALLTPAPQEDPRLVQLEQRVRALSQTGNLQALENRIRTLESAQAATDRRFEAVQGAAEQAAARAEEAMKRPPPAAPAAPNDKALTDLSGRVSAVETQARSAAQSATGAAGAAQALERRVADQDQRLATLTRQVTEGGKGAESASQAGIRLVLTQRLSDALRSGAPYADTLSALTKTGGDAARLASLDTFAATGAPTAAALAQSFKSPEAAILRDDRAASGASWTDRLLRMADRIVTVRPVSGPGATGVSGLVARIEQALAQGNVADAAAAWESLPEPARRLSEDWGRQAKARAEADRAAQALAADALAGLSIPTQQ